MTCLSEMKISAPLLGTLLSLATATSVFAADTSKVCQGHSPGFRAAVIELYTSEGCSSCPPADDWLRRLPRDDLESGRVVPLALHVDYWNHLGWRDPFSQPQFTTRQRTLAARNHSQTIYTPGLFLNGKEWRGWHRDHLAARTAGLATERPAANIQLSASARDNSMQLRGAVSWNRDFPQHMALYIAVLESDLVTRIAAGENAGRTLHHGHVVRYLSDAIVLTPQEAKFEHRLALPTAWKRTSLGVAAFVEDSASGEILQAVSLPRCPG